MLLRDFLRANPRLENRGGALTLPFPGAVSMEDLEATYLTASRASAPRQETGVKGPVAQFQGPEEDRGITQEAVEARALTPGIAEAGSTTRGTGESVCVTASVLTTRSAATPTMGSPAPTLTTPGPANAPRPRVGLIFGDFQERSNDDFLEGAAGRDSSPPGSGRAEGPLDGIIFVKISMN